MSINRLLNEHKFGVHIIAIMWTPNFVLLVEVISQLAVRRATSKNSFWEKLRIKKAMIAKIIVTSLKIICENVLFKLS